MRTGAPSATSTLAFVPELALSDHSSDLASEGEDGEAAYSLGAADGWISDDDGGPDPAAAAAADSSAGPKPADVTRGKAVGLEPWAKERWDDAALYGAFLAAKEEYLLFNDPVQPYAPFEVPDDLRARAKVKGKDSWKVRLELREAEARAALEAAEGPVEGCVELSALWYTRIGGRPKPEEVPQPESKRSKARAAKLRKAEQKAAAQAAKVAVDPYGSAATAGNASRKRKLPQDTDGAEPASPEDYTPMSPSFSPSHTPLSPSLTGADPDLPPLDAVESMDADMGLEGAPEELEWEGLVVANNQLDPAQWDDTPLLSAWEHEEAAFAARHGTGKSWLTLATEAETLSVPLEDHVASLEAARLAREHALPGVGASLVGPEGAEPKPKVDKVAERHLRRFAQASSDVASASVAPSSATPADPVPELSYD